MLSPYQHRDLSIFALLAAGLSLVPAASAYRTPVGDSPSGNAVYTPTLNQTVPVSQQFQVTWNATTTKCSTVDIILLKGPSSDLVYVQTLETNYTNSGSYEWTPSKNLTTSEKQGYGLELICDDSGAYQYSDQFGIYNAVSNSTISNSSTTSLNATGSTTVPTSLNTATATGAAAAVTDGLSASASSTSSSSTATPATYTPSANVASRSPTAIGGVVILAVMALVL